MMWSDRVAESGSSPVEAAPPQLVDPNNDAWLLEGKDEQRWACSSRNPYQETVGFSQLHIHVMPNSKARQ